MAKIRVSRNALERLALAEIRGEEGCEEIVSVEIEYAPCRITGNWRICTVDFGEERVIVRPSRAVDLTHRRMWRRYELLTDS